MESKIRNIVLSILGAVVVSGVITNIQLKSIKTQTEIINSSNYQIQKLIQEKEDLRKQVLNLKKQVLPL